MMIKFKSIKVFDFTREDVIHYILSMKVSELMPFVEQLKKELSERI